MAGQETMGGGASLPDIGPGAATYGGTGKLLTTVQLDAKGRVLALTVIDAVGSVLDGTGLTTTVPLTVKNGRSQSGYEAQVTGTVATGFVLKDSGGTARGAWGYAVSANDWLTASAAGDVALLGDATKMIRLGALGAANPVVSIDLANKRVGIGVNSPSYAIHIAGTDTATGRIEVVQNTTSSQAMIEMAMGSGALTLKCYGSALAATPTVLGMTPTGGVSMVGFPVANGMAVGTGTNFATILGTNNLEQARLTPAVGLQMTAARLSAAKGADVAAAGTTTLGGDGSSFGITGTGTIDYITKTNWQAGSEITLRFAAAATVNHNSGSVPGTAAAILLSGAANITFAANTILKLYFDGTNWIDVRKVA